MNYFVYSNLTRLHSDLDIYVKFEMKLYGFK